MGKEFQASLADYDWATNVSVRAAVWSQLCTFGRAKGRKGVTMDFAIILIVSNTLLAAFIYFVVTRIWQD